MRYPRKGKREAKFTLSFTCEGLITLDFSAIIPEIIIFRVRADMHQLVIKSGKVAKPHLLHGRPSDCCEIIAAQGAVNARPSQLYNNYDGTGWKIGGILDRHLESN